MKTTSHKIIGIGTVLFACALTISLSQSPAPAFANSPDADHGHKPVYMLPTDLKWTDSPALPAGVKVSMLYGDMKQAGPIGFRIKVPAGFKIAPHTHPVDERV